MGVRRPRHNLVKIHRSYSVSEAAQTLGVSKGTVRQWIKDGLPVVDSKRPKIVLGCDLKEYLLERRAKRKVSCGRGEFYCLKCRKPQKPALGMVDYLPMSDTSGNLRGICSICETLMFRRVTKAKINEVMGDFPVQFPEGEGRINKCEKPSLNRYFEKDPVP